MKFFTSLIISLFAITQLYATKRVQIVYFGDDVASVPHKLQVYSSGTELQQVGLSKNAFSETFIISAESDKLYFFDANDTVDLKDKEEISSAPSVVLPQGSNKILLLAFPYQNNEKLPIRLLAIPADDDIFKNGELYLHNYSDKGVAGTIGKHKLSLKPKGKKLLTNPAPSGEIGYSAKLDCYDFEAKTKSILLRSKWRHMKTRRMFMVFYNKQPSGEVSHRVYLVRDL